jgi:hypothetical protein
MVEWGKSNVMLLIAGTRPGLVVPLRFTARPCARGWSFRFASLLAHAPGWRGCQRPHENKIEHLQLPANEDCNKI